MQLRKYTVWATPILFLILAFLLYKQTESLMKYLAIGLAVYGIILTINLITKKLGLFTDSLELILISGFLVYSILSKQWIVITLFSVLFIYIFYSFYKNRLKIEDD